ncbi:EcnA/B family entericidin [Marinicauda salina]|uniref:EcnA/B family entericidin n=1 Tax=Marinicauda salina TaxID=2135793 RepID=A0A2U2BXT0_9PROT|nr:entericidin A/B family lipoprotein [Marinicauda salina]PWE18810.1 EcnA/B family entericidin [Marinicauda salina]
MKRFFALIAGVFMLLGAAGCNTLQGAGQDLEEAGEELDEEI